MYLYSNLLHRGWYNRMIIVSWFKMLRILQNGADRSTVRFVIVHGQSEVRLALHFDHERAKEGAAKDTLQRQS